MCGIAGFIGEPKKPGLSFQLATKLFEKTESRGFDAAGFWGVESGDGSVVYHKEPSRSSQLVKKDVWKKVGKLHLNLLQMHARAASQGVGSPVCNTNNHPFASHDRTVALCHNGRIYDEEYKSLSQKYQVASQCDSEILLRIFEGAEQHNLDDLTKEYPGISSELLRPIAGISDIFSYTNDGHMAVSIGERLPDGNRRLWLFRNIYRPLWIVDLREILGQIFYFSEPRIWDEALRECKNVQAILTGQKMVELLPEQIWLLSGAGVPEVARFEVLKDSEHVPYSVENQIKIIKKPMTCKVISKISDEVEVEGPKLLGNAFDLLHDISEMCVKIRKLSKNIELKAIELQQHNSLERQTLDNTETHLKSCEVGLEAILTHLAGSEA